MTFHFGKKHEKTWFKSQLPVAQDWRSTWLSISSNASNTATPWGELPPASGRSSLPEKLVVHNRNLSTQNGASVKAAFICSIVAYYRTLPMLMFPFGVIVRIDTSADIAATLELLKPPAASSCKLPWIGWMDEI